MRTFLLPGIASLFAVSNKQQSITVSNGFFKKRIVTFAIFFWSAVAMSQITNLKFSAAQFTYTEISGGTNLVAGGSAIGAASAVTPIGFNFVFQGNTYANFSVNAAGLLKLGTVAVTTESANNASSTTNTPKLYAWWDATATMAAANGGGVTFALTGTAPNRVLTVQWRVAYTTNATTGFSYQVKLYETTNVIEYLYGAVPPSGTLSASVGLGNFGANEYQSFYTFNNIPSSTLNYNANTIFPGAGAGFRYTFTPSFAALSPANLANKPSFWLKADGAFNATRTLLNVPAGSRTASSELSTTWTAANSVLNGANAWIANTTQGGMGAPTENNQLGALTLDLGSIQTIHGVATLGAGSNAFYTKDYMVRVSNDNVTYTDLGLFMGNELNTALRFADFDAPVSCRYVRIIPSGFEGRRALRVDVYTKTPVTIPTNTRVSNWEDNSGNQWHAYQNVLASQPNFNTNQINFNPAVNFTNNPGTSLNIPDLANIRQSYWVAQDATAAGNTYFHVLFGNEATTLYGTTATTPNFFGGLAGAVQFTSTMSASQGGWRKDGTVGSAASTYDFGPQGKPNLMTSFSLADNAPFSAQSISFQSGTNRSWQGPIAEIITFQNQITANQHNIVETYLGIKYGISVGHDYVAPDGTILWNRTTNTAYHNNVFGIGRSDSQGLHQRQSFSTSFTGRFITLGNNSVIGATNAANVGNNIATDNSYLLLGDNNAPILYEETLTGDYYPLLRKWRVSNIGISAATKISVPAFGNASSNALPNSSTDRYESETFYLVLDTDGDGNFSNATYTPMTKVGTGANATWEINQVLPNNAVIGFAVKQNLNDTDGDSVLDGTDIDDDNDGVIDALEQTDCKTMGRDMRYVTMNGAAIANKTENTINTNTTADNATWISSYSTETYSLPLSLKFRRETNSGQAMVGLIPVGNTQTPNNYTDNGYKFYLLGTNAYGYFGATWNFTHTSIPDEEYSIDISATGFVTVRINGVQRHAFQGANSAYRFVVSTSVATIALKDIRLTNATHPERTVCLDRDTDGDGVANRLELDSDNDGCSDAIEAGTVSNLSATTVAAPYGTNGLANSLETVADNGVYNRAVNYFNARIAEIKGCADADGDSVADLVDVDDDNDGITDAQECTPFNINNLNYAPQTFSVTNGASASQTFPAAPDGLVVNVWTLDNSFNVRINGMPLVNPPELEFWSLTRNNAIFEFLDGTSHASIWEVVGNQSRPIIRVHIDKFGVVKVFGSRTSGGALEEMRLRNGSFNEILLNTNAPNTFQIGQLVVAQTFITGDYGVIIPPNCDADNDGIPNGLDLDSDGDGCPDAREAGVTGTLNSGTIRNLVNGTLTSTPSVNFAIANAPYGANGLADGLETNENGLTSYPSSYQNFALNAVINACLDTDSDGRPDAFDIDDDNDGVLDVVEQASCGFTGKDITTIPFSGTGVTARTAATITSSNTNNWLSSYSNENFTLPLSLKFKRPTSRNSAMIGLTPSINNLNPATWTDNGYKFYFELTNVNGYFGSSWNFTQATVPDEEYSIDISATGFVTVRINGVQVRAFQGANTTYKLAVSGLTTMQFTDVRLTNMANPEIMTCPDMDNDGRPNYLDLDSDGDGCSDAIESGSSSTLSSTSVFPTGTDTNNNGLLNDYEGSTAGTINYISYYAEYAILNSINTCSDTDNDGVRDIADLDDDNDGVLDETEMTCASTLLPFDGVTISKPNSINYTFNGAFTLDNLIDGVDNNVFVLRSPTGTLNGEWFRIALPSLKVLNYVEIGHYSGQTLFTVGSTYRVEGSLDGINWTNVSGTLTYNNQNKSASGGYSTYNSNAAVFNNNTAYFYYRLVGINATSGGTWATELYFNQRECTDLDTDEDGIPNRLELDSDGDGCSDAKEAGATNSTTANFSFTGNFGNNGFANGLETATESGIFSGTYTYNYAANPQINACLDNDSDSVIDFFDIDDDNDGALDLTETSCTTYLYTGSNTSITVPARAVSMDVKMWGAGGGGSNTNNSTAGSGAYVFGKLNVTPNETLTLIVGQGGINKSPVATFGGGGAGGNDPFQALHGGSGGGRSELRRGSTSLLIAGGGGGAAGSPTIVSYAGGAGIRLGQDGIPNSQAPNGAGKGGTQSAGGLGGTLTGETGFNGANGAQFLGGNGGASKQANAGAGGGGGGGWYGGGGGAGMGIEPFQESSAGGGSSYFHGMLLQKLGIAGNTNRSGGTLTPAPNNTDPAYVAGVGTGGAANSAGGNGLIQICYTLDTDGDGIANQFDLDSDADGCSDAFEAGSVALPTSTSSFPTGTDSNGNGLLNTYEGTTAGTINYVSRYSLYALNNTNSACLDTDTDGVPDLNDLDDDNDGVLDRVECKPNVGRILFAGSNEDFNTMRSSLFNEFNNNKALGATIVQSNIIETATVPAGFYDGYDLVVFGGAAFNTIHANHWAALQTAIQNKTSKAFIIQSDNCCVVANRNGLVSLLNNVFSSNYAVSASQATVDQTFTLNSLNSYGSLFTTPSLVGANYFPIVNVPASDVLFYSPSVAGSAVAGMKQLPGTADQSRFLAWFVDGTITQGAPWYTTNQNKIAKAFFDVYGNTANMDCDTDGDGILNHLDLDSDGDGCTDAIEASVTGSLGSGSVTNRVNGQITTSTRPNAIAAAPYGTNGLADGLETTAGSGVFNGRYTYNFALSTTINACADSDSDGIRDVIDLDDDNDGILDITEQRDCITDVAQLTFNGTPVSNITSTTLTAVGAAAWKSSYSNQVLSLPISLSFKANTTSGLAMLGLISVNRTQTPNDWTDGGYKFYPQGTTMNGYFQSTWDFSQAFTPNDILSIDISETGWVIARINGVIRRQFQGIISDYRVVVSANAALTVPFTDIVLRDQTNNLRKLSCVDIDTDNDNIPNRLDLDSDGDGCFDAAEAGTTAVSTSGVATASIFTTGVIPAPYGANGFADGLEFTAAESGSYKESYTYANATNASVRGCLDTDGDGVPNLNDIDDDNDGVTDFDEDYPECSSASSFNWVNWTAIQPNLAVGTITVGSQTITVTARHSVGGMLTTPNVFQGSNFPVQFGVPISSNTIANNLAGDLTVTFSQPIGAPTFAMASVGNGVANLPVPVVTSIPYQTEWAGLATVYNSPNQFTGTEGFNIVSLRGFGNTFKFNYSVSEGFCNIVFGVKDMTRCSGTPLDTDGDGTPNSLDLDSDGDGCSDAREAGSTLSTAANFKHTTAVGANGLANALETSTENGTYNYTLTYANFAQVNNVNACIDTDSDGIADVLDIDDDNDGVLDETEFNCTTALMPKTGITVSSTVTWGFNGTTLANMVDGAEAIVAFSNSEFLNQTILQFNLPSAKALSQIEIGNQAGNNPLGTTGTYRIQGWNGTSWVDLSGNLTFANTAPINAANNSYKFNMPSNYTAYTRYRILGTSNRGTVSGWIQEAYFVERLCNRDVDGDGIPNHLDLDSDNDGCSDAIEARSSTTATSTSLFPTGTDTNGNGLLNNYEGTTAGTINYTSTYTNYALSTFFNFCRDTDGDGVVDLLDLDGDNDGILDTVECPLTQLNTNESNGTFGTGVVPRDLVNTSVTGGYVYTTTNTGAGQYAVINQNTAFFPNSTLFWRYPGRTTGTATDAYLAVNGSTTVGTFYRESMTLQAGARYRISFWHQAASANNDYQLAAEILSSSNVVLATANTGAQNSLGWKLTTVEYTSTSNQTVTFILKNVSINANGNDFSIDDISFTAIGCPDSDLDGIPNQLDLDSDGDGCSDANEAYGITTAQGTDGNAYYGTGNPPAVDASGKVTGASYAGTNANVTAAGTASVITAQPQDVGVSPGATISFTTTVTAGSTPVAFQWQLSTDGGSTWANVTNTAPYSGATTTTLTVTNVTMSMKGYSYRLIVSQANFVCGTVVSNPAKIEITPFASVVDDAITAAEDTVVNGNVLTNDTGSGNTALTLNTFKIGATTYNAGQTATITGVGTIIVRTNGTFTFTPVANYNGTVPVIEYTATDTVGASDSGTLSIVITPTNDAPIANDDTVTATEDTPQLGNVLTNDTDADGNTLSVTQFTINGVTYNAGTTAAIPGIGTIIVNTNGTYTFTPALNYTGAVPVISYAISDGNGGTDTADLNITVNPANDAPLASDDIVTLNQGATATGNLLTNDTDLEGNTLTITGYTIAGVIGNPVIGTIFAIHGKGWITIEANGSFTFVSDPAYTGPIPIISYTVSDGNGGTDIGDLDLFVQPVNAIPVANADTNTVNEDSLATGNVITNDTDANSGDPKEVTQISFTVGGTTYTYPAGTTATIPGVGTIVVNTIGTYTFTPNSNWNGAVPAVTYTLSDGNGGTATGTLTITVTAVNDNPITVNDDNKVTPEDTPISGNVLSNDSDPEGAAITVTQFTINGTNYTAGTTATISGVGTLIVNTNGTYIFTPAANYSGAVPSVTYTARDASGGTGTATLNLAVTPVNDSPDAINDTVNSPEGTAATGNVLSNDTDPEGNTKTVASFEINGITYQVGTIVTISGKGSIILNADGTYTFTPLPNFNGVVPAITYTLSDGNGGTDSATLLITIIAVNDPPVVAPETIVTTEDTPATGNVLSNDTDAEGNTLSITQFSIGGQNYNAGQTATVAGVGTITIASNGAYTFTPVADYNGVVPVVGYKVTDGTSVVDGSLSISVSPVNDAPTARNNSESVLINTVALGNVVTNDSDLEGDTVTVTQFTIQGVSGTFIAGQTATIPGKGTLIINTDGSYTFTPDTNYYGAVPLTTYTVSDGTLTATATLTLNVTAPDTDGDGVYDFKELSDGTDPNNFCDYLAASVMGTRTGAWNLADCDGDGTPNSGDTAPLDPCVHAVNAQPDRTNALWQAADCDQDGETNGIENTNGTNPNNACSYTTAPIASSSVYSTWSALDCDSDGLTNGAEVSGSTNPLNLDTDGDGNPDNTDTRPTVPTATNNTANAVPGTATTINILGNDDFLPNDNNVITQTGGTATGSATFDSLTGEMTYTPAAGEEGSTVTVIYQVCQGSVCATATVSITVASINSVPVAVDDAVSTAEDTPVSGNVLTNDTDADGNTLTVTGYTIAGVTGTFNAGQTATIPNVGTIVVNADGTFTFTPVANYNGTVPAITYTTSDGNGGTDTGALNITVTAVNDAPVAVDDAVSTAEDTPVSGNVLTNDTDTENNTLTVTGYTIAGVTGPFTIGTVETIPGVGTIVVNADGTFTFTPVANYNGTVPAITYTTSDSNGGTDTGALNITVTAVNDVPVISNETATIPQNTDATGNVLTNDIDIDGGTLSVTQFTIVGVAGTFTAGQTATIPGVGTIVVNVNGTFTFTPATNYYGPVPVTTYTVSDGNGGTTTGTLSLSVTSVDTDGDGVLDFQELIDGTLPTDPCSLLVASQVVTPSTAWNNADCDGDGTPNGTDTQPLNPCVGGSGTPVTTNAIWAAADCDGDGLTNNTEGLNDTDGDGTPDYRDTDSDNDGITDAIEKGPNSTPVDTDGDGTPDYRDLDSDNDGITDLVEKGPSATPIDTDGDGTPDYRDLDSDGDGISDAIEKGPNSTPIDTDGDGTPDYRDLDSDNDGIPDTVEKGPNATPRDTDGDGTPDYRDTDSDNDGITDAIEKGPNATPRDTDSDGTPDYIDVDSDGDGKTDSQEGLIDTDNDGTPNYRDLDSDGDGVLDTVDQCPLAVGAVANNGCPTDFDGDGIDDMNDLDDDNDGILDTVENGICSPASANCDTDGDGIPNRLDSDSDNDGISDVRETNGTDANGDGKVDGSVDSNGVPQSSNGGVTPPNTDGDANPNPYDLDSDGDGIPDAIERGPNGNTPVDTDGDGKPDYLDLDSDGDGIPDTIEKGTGTSILDTDGDGIPDYRDLDSDGDGIPDAIERGPNGNTPVDTDGDGTPDYRDLDSDGDGISDAIEKGPGTTPVDTDGDGTPDYRDLDSDNDGITDAIEKGPNSTPVDTDGDGIPDYRDLDSDNDGITDAVEKGPGATPIDTDGDGTPDYRDLDSDGDGIPDATEDSVCSGTLPCTPTDTDGDGTPDYRDLDSDGDGISDAIEKGPGATPVDTDGDGIPDYRDLDSDGDGISDAIEKGSGTTPVDTDNDGIPDYLDLDSDGDNKPDNQEGNIDIDGDGIPNYRDLDSDGDGILDNVDYCPYLAGVVQNNGCPLDSDGDGIYDINDLDDDNDGILDTIEAATCSPSDANCDTDGDGIPNRLDPDSDNDGISDVRETNGVDVNGDGKVDGGVDANGVPQSSNGGVTPPNTDGTDNANPYDTDSDGDGIPDSIEKGPNGNTPLDTDGDGIPDYLDLDSDNDGISDAIEKGSGIGVIDTDGDGTPDYRDTDSDNDGITDAIEKGPGATPRDTDGDGTPDYRDLDSDGDGIPDAVEKGPGATPRDTDGDGTPDYRDLDSDGDGIPDAVEKGPNATPVDTDNDGTPDYRDLDSDGDGIPDAVERGTGATPIDTDGDGTPDYRDLDSDGDGILDAIERGSGATPIDTDGDGTPDYRDLDSDGDGIPDAVEKGPGATPIDTDGDGTPDYRDLDSDGDGIPDAVERGPNGAPPIDTDGDGTPDYRDLDSDGDGIPDAVEKGPGATPIDTDGDGTPDYRDLDSDGDGIQDAIERGPNGAPPIDTDGDGTPDYRDLDSDGDGIPDAVERGPNGATPIDTDGDGTPDYRDLDSDGDGIPDAVEKGPNATPVDTDGDGTPDYRDLDTDGDGIPDAIERGPNGATPIDTDGDGIPDYRDLPNVVLNPDTDGDGVTDNQEGLDGTDPNNPCDSVPASVTLPFSSSFLSGDCDGDGLTNRQELGSNPKLPTDIDNNGKPDYLEFNNHSQSEDDLEIFNSMTVNGDELNDSFVIRGIENYPNNTLIIYNRWGVEVYNVEGYGQNNKFFRGISEGRVTVSQSAELPKGTYYYILKYVNKQGIEKQRSGYLYIAK